MRQHDNRLLFAIWTAATYGLLRLGELLHRHLHVRWAQDIIQKDGSVLLHIPVGKTAEFRAGFDIKLFRIPVVSCPASAMERYLAESKHWSSMSASVPLFIKSDGKVPKRKWVVSCLRAYVKLIGLPVDNVSGHSFRKGGATSLANAKAPDHVIKVMGRWVSWAYQLYPSTSEDSIREAFEKMGRSEVVFAGFDPSSQLDVHYRQ